MIDEEQYVAMRLRERIAFATAAAMFAAGVILVTVVLPAEYGLDPVGTGRVLGLTQMAQAEAGAVAPVAAAASVPASTGEPAPTIEGEGGRPTLTFTQPTPATTGEDGEPILEWNRAGADRLQPRPFRRDARRFDLGPNEAMEFKYRIEKDGGFVYSWTSTGKVQVDFHGEPEGKPRGYAEFYNQSERERADGTFVAPSPGIHGWYWKNLTSDPITITLNTAGYFERGTEYRESGRTEHTIPE
jgi:hypothetical protein